MTKNSQSLSYKDAGVDIDAGNALIEKIKGAAKRTRRPEVMAGLGGFGALFELPTGYREPVMVSGTDGVGTKLRLALDHGKHDTVGIDLVAMCVNDLIVCGAEPLFFLDYYATGKLDIDTAAAVVNGIADGCELSGCSLIGGETAEMPGVYREGAWDIAGTLVGVVERSRILGPERVREGDALLALPSSGPHTNGYSLIRKVVAGQDLSAPVPELGESLKEALLRPHRAYLKEFRLLWEAGVELHAAAHITGGGLPENLPRALPPGLGAEVRRGSWPIPPVFPYLQRLGGIPEEEMYRVFNMGLGMVLVLPQEAAEEALKLVEGFLVGRVVPGEGVRLV